MNKLSKLFETYNQRHSQIYNKMLFELVQDIMQLLTDEELETIYETYKEPFATISGMREQDIVERPDLIQQAIDILTEYVNSKPVTLEDLRNMTLQELQEYAVSLIQNTDEKTILEINALKESLA